MKKLFLGLTAGIVVLVMSLVVFADTSSNFDLAEEGGSGASGEVTMNTRTVGDGRENVKIRIWMKDLDPMPGYVYEGWLVDEDTDYKLSLGAFTTRSTGKGWYIFEQKMVNIDLYDKVVITKEMIGDTNPNPDTPVLAGMIP